MCSHWDEKPCCLLRVTPWVGLGVLNMAYWIGTCSSVHLLAVEP